MFNSFKLQRPSFISMLLVMLFSIAVVAIPLSRGDVPLGRDIPVYLLGRAMSHPNTVPEDSWIYFGDPECLDGVGLQLVDDPECGPVTRKYEHQHYGTRTLLGTVHFGRHEDVWETIGRPGAVLSNMAQE
ncbi:hypothetical protein F5879DRAFT_927458 [Lentinula edodes]|nr:hypothetical protein F5879DRAFT_927458 [Lentinula edodes]